MRYGIELEFSTITKSYQVVNGKTFHSYICSRIDSLASSTSERWVLENDNSCGNELISPILNYEQHGLRPVKFICDIIAQAEERIRTSFGSETYNLVGRDTGVHYHMEPNRTISDVKRFKQIRNVMLLAIIFEPMFYAMNPPSRLATKFSAPLNVNVRQLVRARDILDLRDIWFRPYMGVTGLQDSHRIVENNYGIDFINGGGSPNKYDWTRYHGFNLVSYFKHGTLEWRYTHGSFNYNILAGWFDVYRLIMEAGLALKANDILDKDVFPIPKHEMFKSGRCSYISSYFNRNISTLIRYYIDVCKPQVQTVQFIVSRIAKFHGHSQNMDILYNEINKARTIDECKAILSKTPVAMSAQYAKQWHVSNAEADGPTNNFPNNPTIIPAPQFVTNIGN